MSDKKDSYMPEDEWEGGAEWHLEFGYRPDLPCPFPIVLAGTRDKHDPVGHLSNDGRVHVFNTGIIEQLVRAGLRMRR
jgi:hypothetical protein